MKVIVPVGVPGIGVTVAVIVTAWLTMALAGLMLSVTAGVAREITSVPLVVPV